MQRSPVATVRRIVLTIFLSLRTHIFFLISTDLIPHAEPPYSPNRSATLA